MLRAVLWSTTVVNESKTHSSEHYSGMCSLGVGLLLWFCDGSYLKWDVLCGGNKNAYNQKRRRGCVSLFGKGLKYE